MLCLHAGKLPLVYEGLQSMISKCTVSVTTQVLETISNNEQLQFSKMTEDLEFLLKLVFTAGLTLES